MYVKKIYLENYRNYVSEEIEFDPKTNIIIGENAQGKTNLIESIYLCAIGRSFRTSRYRELVKFGEEFAKIRIDYVKKEALEEEEKIIEMVITADGKKAVRAQGIRLRRITELLDHLSAVVFSPEDLKIVKEDPAKRRSFIDRELSQMKLRYLNNLKLYNQVLSQRNAFLKERKNDIRDIFIWDEKIVEYGAQIMRERNEFIKKLSEISGKIHNSITNGKEELKIIYKPGVKVDFNETEESIENAIQAALDRNHNVDLKFGNTGKGPHKDDFDVVVNGTAARNFGSQGQQRTAALSLKLAEIELLREEKGDDPVLLLDDVLSELDQERQKYLIETLKDVQLFITTTGIDDEIASSLRKSSLSEADTETDEAAGASQPAEERLEGKIIEIAGGKLRE